MPMQDACRYAANPDRFPGHVCRNRDGDPTHGEQVCWFEAHNQILESQRLDRLDADDRAWEQVPA